MCHGLGLVSRGGVPWIVGDLESWWWGGPFPFGVTALDALRPHQPSLRLFAAPPPRKDRDTADVMEIEVIWRGFTMRTATHS